MRLAVEDGERFDLVAVGFQVFAEVLGQGLRVLLGVALPFGALHGVQAVVIDGLLLVAADRVDQVYQLSGEHAGGGGGEQVTRLVHGGRGRIVVSDRGIDLTRLGFDPVGVDGRQQVADDVGQFRRRRPVARCGAARRRRAAG